MRVKPITQGQQIADKILQDKLLKELRDSHIRSLENKIDNVQSSYAHFFKNESKNKNYKILKISEENYNLLVGIVDQHIMELEESIEQGIKVPSIMKAQLSQAKIILEDLIIS